MRSRATATPYLSSFRLFGLHSSVAAYLAASFSLDIAVQAKARANFKFSVSHGIKSSLSDTVFAAFCEETGFVGALILVFLFIIFLVKTMKNSIREKNEFIRILGPVLAAEIVLQAFLNMGAMMGVFPLTGIPLPFTSYGGSHLVVELIMMGLLLNISKS